MSMSNIGPEHSDPSASDAFEGLCRGNPALVFRDEPIADDVFAASTRASAISHRFGGVRYALSRPRGFHAPRPTAEEGESDARD
ncbi:hypothetical protein Acsp01_55110 [Actinoplanes sp. NBRC 101535]|nr:hypothetical protein Acsp01_55110 [Actinoplanes sp. NBRC 101535]